MTPPELTAPWRCYSRHCPGTLVPPGEDMLYCPACGAAQVYECEVCRTRPGGLIQVDRDVLCPSCGALYARCRSCFHPVPVGPDQPMRCPEGCEAGVTEARSGACEPLVNAARTGTLVCPREAQHPTEAVVWQAGEAISPPACRYGRVFFATARGILRALSDDTWEAPPAWQSPALPGVGDVDLAALQLQVSERYVYCCTGQAIHAFSVVDGRTAFSLALGAGQFRAVISDDRLLVSQRAGNEALRLELYDTVRLCRQEEGLRRREDVMLRNGQGAQPVAFSAACEVGFLVRDLAGDLRLIAPDSQQDSRVLWQNPGFGYVSEPAASDASVYLLAHSLERDAALVRVSLRDGRVTERVLHGLAPAYIGLRATRCGILVFDGVRDYLLFGDLDPSTPPVPIFHGQELKDDATMHSLVAVESGATRGVWLASLAGRPGQLTPQMVHSHTHQRPTLPPPRSGRAALAVSDRHVIVCDLETGELVAHCIPRAGSEPVSEA